jgi:hypothetical protein
LPQLVVVPEHVPLPSHVPAVVCVLEAGPSVHAAAEHDVPAA